MKELHIRNPFIPLSLSEFCTLHGLSETEALQEIADGHLVTHHLEGQQMISFDALGDWREKRRPIEPYRPTAMQAFDAEPGVPSAAAPPHLCESHGNGEV